MMAARAPATQAAAVELAGSLLRGVDRTGRIGNREIWPLHSDRKDRILTSRGLLGGGVTCA